VSRLQEQREQLTAAELAAATLQADLVVAALRQSRDLREWNLKMRVTDLSLTSRKMTFGWAKVI